MTTSPSRLISPIVKPPDRASQSSPDPRLVRQSNPMTADPDVREHLLADAMLRAGAEHVEFDGHGHLYVQRAGETEPERFSLTTEARRYLAGRPPPQAASKPCPRSTRI